MYKITCRTSIFYKNQFSSPVVFEVLVQQIQQYDFEEFLFVMLLNAKKTFRGNKK